MFSDSAHKLLENGNWSIFFLLYMEHLLKIWSHYRVFQKEMLLSHEEITVSFIKEVIYGLGLQTF